MSNFGAIKIIDSAGLPQGVLMEDNCITNRDYLIAVAEGEITNHERFSRIGYTPTMTTTDSDVWSGAGVVPLPTAATTMAVFAGATDDGTPVAYSGTASGGSTTTLVDAAKNFTTLPVVAGDCIVVDKSGTTPEWGYVTSLTGNTQLNVSGGFSSGGNPNGRPYVVLQKSFSVGAHAVMIEYLDVNYATKHEIVVTNGAADVNLINQPFRIQEVKVIATGSLNTCAGPIQVRAPASTVYANISAGFTKARSSLFTTPAGTTLFINKLTAGFSLAAGTKWEYARMYLRVNHEPERGFATGNIFYPIAEIIANNSTVVLPFTMPIKILPKTDVKFSGIASAAGVAVCSYRGWLET